jgi:hypothetical protein
VTFDLGAWPIEVPHRGRDVNLMHQQHLLVGDESSRPMIKQDRSIPKTKFSVEAEVQELFELGCTFEGSPLHKRHPSIHGHQ